MSLVKIRGKPERQSKHLSSQLDDLNLNNEAEQFQGEDDDDESFEEIELNEA
jgi:hypothetical protein